MEQYLTLSTMDREFNLGIELTTNSNRQRRTLSSTKLQIGQNVRNGGLGKDILLFAGTMSVNDL